MTAVGFTVVWRSLSFIISDRLILCSYYWCVANNCIMGHSAQHHHQEQYIQLSTRPPQSHSIFLMRYLIFSLCVCWQTKHLIGRFLLLVQLQCLTGDTAGCSHIHAGEGENISRKLLLPLTSYLLARQTERQRPSSPGSYLVTLQTAVLTSLPPLPGCIVCHVC